MKNAITNYENTFYFDGAALSGVISVDGSYNVDYSPLNSLGKGFLKQVMSAPPSANMSVTRYLTNSDPILNFTGTNKFVAERFDAGLFYKNKFFAFQKGYLSSLGISCSVGEIPQIQSSFDVYGDIGPNFNPSGDKYAGAVFVPQVKDILLTTRGSTTNRINNFSIDYSLGKQVIYGISSSEDELPFEVHNVVPIEVTTSFGMEIDDYETKRAFSDLTSNGSTNFSISINGAVLSDITLDSADGEPLVDAGSSGGAGGDFKSYDKGDSASIFNFTASDAIIVSEQVSSTSDEVMSVNLSYKTYLN